MPRFVSAVKYLPFRKKVSTMEKSRKKAKQRQARVMFRYMKDPNEKGGEYCNGCIF